MRYVGTAQGMESKLVPPTGIPLFTVKTGAVKNQSPLKIARTLLLLMRAVFWSLAFLRREKPDAVLGVGGYVSVPVCFAAFLLRIPIYLQEQNVSVGIANRFLGKLSRKIFLGFSQAAQYFPKGRSIVSGNPVRKDFLRSDFPKLNPQAESLFIFGGSQGAKSINDALLAMLPELLVTFPKLTILHQTGEKDLANVTATYAALWPNGNYRVQPFVTDMYDAYAKASLVICRSGALTTSELIQVGRPSLLVPYPRKGQNDQTSNAYFLQENKVARVAEQGENFHDRFRTTLLETFVSPVLGDMGSHFSRLRLVNPLVTIADHIVRDLDLPK